MGRGATNKRMGSNAERLYAKLFRELGFSHCLTSRQGSRIHDDAGVDLINLPFNVQIKAGKQQGLRPNKELRSIRERLGRMFPKTSGEVEKPLFLIHRKHVGRGKKRDDFDDMVSMSFEDFKNLISKIEWD